VVLGSPGSICSICSIPCSYATGYNSRQQSSQFVLHTRAVIDCTVTQSPRRNIPVPPSVPSLRTDCPVPLPASATILIASFPASTAVAGGRIGQWRRQDLVQEGHKSYWVFGVYTRRLSTYYSRCQTFYRSKYIEKI